jgi:hypothetical protein
LPVVCNELRKLGAQRLAHEKPGQIFQPTALFREAYLRLVGIEQMNEGGDVIDVIGFLSDPTHFLIKWAWPANPPQQGVEGGQAPLYGDPNGDRPVLKCHPT